MMAALQKIEEYLRIDELHRTSDVLRARAIYMFAAAMALSQIVNIAILSATYGRWTFDHWVAVGAAVAILTTILALRYTKAFYLFAGFYSLFMFVGIAAVSIFENTGINSALLPFLLLGSVACGFISGWRMVVLYGLAATAFIWGLYYVSVTAPQGALFDPTLFAARHIQRAAQITIALWLTSALSGLFSYAMHSAFYELEDTAELANRSSKAKTRFMSDMSHELRTPLNGIMGMSEILLTTDLDVKRHQYVKNIHNCSHTLMAILEGAMDISKLDEDKFTLEIAPFNLQELLQSVIGIHKPSALSQSVILGLRYSDEVPKDFVGDRQAIHKILNNLMNNAVKFTKTGSVYIHVNGKAETTATPGEKFKISISVQDTGIGIARKHMRKIFNRFSQLDIGLSRQYDGSGLGLSVSKTIAELIGGNLQVQSRPGKGSTFTLELVLPVSETPKVETPPLDLFHPPTKDLIPISHDPEGDEEKRTIG